MGSNGVRKLGEQALLVGAFDYLLIYRQPWIKW
jgi:hypothetical protein